MFWRSLVSALAVAGVVSAQVSGPGAYTPGSPFNAPYWGAFVPGGILTGQVVSLTIPNSEFTTISDILPDSQYVDGWTASLRLKNFSGSLTGSTASYNFGASTPASNNLNLTVRSPAYDSTGAATTTTRTVYATAWLRQTYTNQSLPTEAAVSADGDIGLVFSDYLYSGDTATTNSMVGSLYTGAVSTTNFTVTNNSTQTWPTPIAAWTIPPGEKVGSSGGKTFEIFAGHPYGGNLYPVAAVKFTVSDGTHTATHTVSTMTQSTVQWQTTCTALDRLDGAAMDHVATLKRELDALEGIVGAKACARLHVAMTRAAASLEAITGVASGTYGGIQKPPSLGV